MLISPLLSRARNTVARATDKASPAAPSGRRTTKRTAFSAAAIILASSLTVLGEAALQGSPALADPCSGGSGGFGCGYRDGGRSGGGSGGGGGGSGGGGSGEIPELDGDGSIGLPETRDGEGGSAEPLPTIYWAEVARSRANLPVPLVHTAPRDKTYVGLRTSLWVENFHSVETPRIGDGDQQVWAVATPKYVVWNLGDKSITCNGAGSAGSLSCSHTYNRASTSVPGGTYKVTATIVWGVEWYCVGSDCDDNYGTLEDLSMISAPYPYVVSEIQTNSRP
ncbi:hypothetical protein Tcur_1139 [Thermomonospora curvata DSM 43183]|uniref:Uncharacterized protein n=1 Tax=Thermomonospora curvata (strain ATCC 19995 / DSM 43183 / JCM 3096 / KCTC 9072 / NBRC 15933 / NCIMB 10081 / Henssen B9) TaxID=471852 RepID=D1A8M9_THECD|nr:hypothetical protein Tcur_1139 [Thermomonospora curvata DSM 43183]